MATLDWVKEFPGAITICDTTGIILDMNNQAEIGFKNDGGKELIGTNLLNCHPEPARSQLGKMLENQQANVYSIEKNGVKKLIYQTPWYKDEVYGGFVELSLEIPTQMPHFIRQSQ